MNATPTVPPAADEQLIALVGAALAKFGRGIRCTLRVSGVSAVLIFPDDKPKPNTQEPSKC